MKGILDLFNDLMGLIVDGIDIFLAYVEKL